MYVHDGPSRECLWVKADMVLFAGNTVSFISDRIRGIRKDALYKSTLLLPSPSPSLFNDKRISTNFVRSRLVLPHLKLFCYTLSG